MAKAQMTKEQAQAMLALLREILSEGLFEEPQDCTDKKRIYWLMRAVLIILERQIYPDRTPEDPPFYPPTI